MARKRSAVHGKLSTDGHRAVLKRVRVVKAKKSKKAAKKKK